MRYVLDASIAVAALRPNEPLYRAACAHLVPLFRGDDSVVVPALFAVEVAATLARRGMPRAHVYGYLDLLLAHADVVTIGPQRARSVCDVAIDTRLRAGDATYVWLAAREGVTLVTDDAEIADRGAARCRVERLLP